MHTSAERKRERAFLHSALSPSTPAIENSLYALHHLSSFVFGIHTHAHIHIATIYLYSLEYAIDGSTAEWLLSLSLHETLKRERKGAYHLSSIYPLTIFILRFPWDIQLESFPARARGNYFATKRELLGGASNLSNFDLKICRVASAARIISWECIHESRRARSRNFVSATRNRIVHATFFFRFRPR